MKEGNPNKQIIVSLGNDKAQYWLEYQARCIQQHLPQYEYYVYNLGGLKPEPFLNTNVPKKPIFVNWSEIDQEHDVFWGSTRDMWKTVKMPSITINSLRKAWCVRDCIRRNITAKNLQIIYLDADAFPIQPLDEVWKNDFNLGVTLRKVYKCPLNIAKFAKPIRFRYKLLNAGVQFYNGTPELLDKSINFYIYKFLLDKTCIADQAAWNRMIDLCDGFDWTHWDRTYPLKIGHKDYIKVHIFSCRSYNWFTEGGKAPDRGVKICHAKGTYKREARSVEDMDRIIDRRKQGHARFLKSRKARR